MIYIFWHTLCYSSDCFSRFSDSVVFCTAFGARHGNLNRDSIILIIGDFSTHIMFVVHATRGGRRLVVEIIMDLRTKRHTN